MLVRKYIATAKDITAIEIAANDTKFADAD